MSEHETTYECITLQNQQFFGPFEILHKKFTAHTRNTNINCFSISFRYQLVRERAAEGAPIYNLR